MRAIDLTGKRFGRLVALSRAAKAGSALRWLCLCDCGTEHIVRTGNLASGAVKSCGCLSSDTTKLRMTTHGRRKSPEYNSWCSMRARCMNPKHKAYGNYSGRGITVCESWANSFDAFFADMGLKPTPRHSLERIDNNEGYYPANCKWATPREQNNNRRSNRMVTYKGKTQTLMEATRSLGVSYAAVLLRVQKGWDVADALETPIINARLKSDYFKWLARQPHLKAVSNG